MAIDLNEAKKLAKLSRLEFTEDELKKFANEFEGILSQVKAIDKVDVSKIDLKESSAKILATKLREDIVQASFSQCQVIQNAPSKKDGAFLVPITVDEEGCK